MGGGKGPTTMHKGAAWREDARVGKVTADDFCVANGFYHLKR
jgi:hypothetical protein